MIDWKDLSSVVERYRRFRETASPGERPYADLIPGALEWVDPKTFAVHEDPEEASMRAVLEFPRRDERGLALVRALPRCP